MHPGPYIESWIATANAVASKIQYRAHSSFSLNSFSIVYFSFLFPLPSRINSFPFFNFPFLYRVLIFSYFPLPSTVSPSLLSVMYLISNLFGSKVYNSNTLLTRTSSSDYRKSLSRPSHVNTLTHMSKGLRPRHPSTSRD